MVKQKKKSEEYREQKHRLEVHEKEFNHYSAGVGISVFYVKSRHQGPFFLAELEEDFAEAGSKEEALEKLNRFLASKRK